VVLVSVKLVVGVLDGENDSDPELEMLPELDADELTLLEELEL
jgi:hypothetical protein